MNNVTITGKSSISTIFIATAGRWDDLLESLQAQLSNWADWGLCRISPPVYVRELSGYDDDSHLLSLDYLVSCSMACDCTAVSCSWWHVTLHAHPVNCVHGTTFYCSLQTLHHMRDLNISLGPSTTVNCSELQHFPPTTITSVKYVENSFAINSILIYSKIQHHLYHV